MAHEREPRRAGGGEEQPARTGALFFGVFAAPAAWAVHLFTSYSLASHACAPEHEWAFHVVSVAGLLLALSGFAVAWRSWSHHGRPARAIEGSPRGRSRFMALIGVASSSFFTLTILAAWVPLLSLEPCR